MIPPCSQPYFFNPLHLLSRFRGEGWGERGPFLSELELSDGWLDNRCPFTHHVLYAARLGPRLIIMEPALPPVLPEVQPEAPKQPLMSLGARLLNVFATPSEVFNDVKAAHPSIANWLVPGLLLALVSALSAIIIFSQPAIRQQLREQQAKAMDKQVQAGRMTAQQTEQALEITEKFTLPIVTVSTAVVSFVRLLWWALILWLLGRWFLKVRFPFVKTLEVAGLASMIIVLGTVVTLLLTINLAKMFATPSLGLLVSDFDATRKSHLMLGAANVFSVWLVGVMSVGLARLAGVAFLRAAWVVFAYWVAQQFFFIFSGLGQFAL